ncbi:hypothetical protein SDC9_135042 [bioreactor metagenome]|uniref:Uncharacterized protein n=1 Tax=bioreactor metagenome TaxID=1076179 RepID=A0A645DFB5_9ZZZZ
MGARHHDQRRPARRQLGHQAGELGLLAADHIGVRTALLHPGDDRQRSEIGIHRSHTAIAGQGCRQGSVACLAPALRSTHHAAGDHRQPRARLLPVGHEGAQDRIEGCVPVGIIG